MSGTQAGDATVLNVPAHQGAQAVGEPFAEALGKDAVFQQRRERFGAAELRAQLLIPQG